MAMEHRLPHDPVLHARELLAFLGARAVAGVEEAVDGTYRRSLALPHGAGIVELSAREDHVACLLTLDDRRDEPDALAAVHRLLRLDLDPQAILAHLGRDPAIGALVRAAPGRRIPGHPDGAELAVRAVLGQQVSVAAATTLAARLVAAAGEPLAAPHGAITHLFPTPARLAALDPATLAMPRSRARALVGLAGALAAGEPLTEALPGIGPWTAGYVALRSGDDDAFLPTDLGVRKGLARVGATAADAERWRPRRAVAMAHLWVATSPL
jgi:AraC family transcriptional regulator of adaptative response / DNA-3-methyladenine glycosylase II